MRETSMPLRFLLIDSQRVQRIARQPLFDFTLSRSVARSTTPRSQEAPPPSNRRCNVDSRQPSRTTSLLHKVLEPPGQASSLHASIEEAALQDKRRATTERPQTTARHCESSPG